MEETVVQTSADSRPYRSHKFPACKVCKARKIACRVDSVGEKCRFCRESNRPCEYPGNIVDNGQESSPKRRKINGDRRAVQISGRGEPGLAPNITGTSPTESSLILDPAMAEDVEAVEHYLTAHGSDSASAAKPYRLVSSMPGKPVVYLTVPRRRKALKGNESNPGAKHREVMEHVLGHHCKQHVIDLYFDKLHPCFPIIDERTFHDLWQKDPEGISSALICDIYASALHFWDTSIHLKKYPRPDLAFMWNQAVAAIQEDYLGSTISTVHASLLDLIGRPVLSITGNIVTLGRTVTLAHSLGLHRDPTNWKATKHEKNVRMRLWWGVVIHDHWSSVAHGTPPLVQRQNYDVPLPHTLLGEDASEAHKQSSASFFHLCKLSQILGDLLPHVYALSPDQEGIPRHIRRLECALDEWQTSLPSFLECSSQWQEQVNGASSLRFCFLSLQLLLCRVAYKATHYDGRGTVPEEKLYRMAMLRDAALRLTEFVSSLQPSQWDEFWLPYTAHLLVFATTVLLRCILEASDLATKKACTEKLVGLKHRLQLARQHGWDLADFCLERCSDPISKIAAAMGVPAEPVADYDTLRGSNLAGAVEHQTDLTLTIPSDFMLPLDSLDYTFDSLWDAAF